MSTSVSSKTVTDPTWEQLLAIGEKARMYCSEERGYGNSHQYVYINFNGKTHRGSGDCFGSLNVGGLRNNALVAMVGWSAWPNFQNIYYNKEQVIEYLKWWMNDSFVAPCFITKDPEDVIKNGALFDCKYPGQLIVIGAIGVRNITYHPQMIRNWCDFKEHIGPDAAICAAHVLMPDSYLKSDKSSVKANYYFSPIQSWFTIDAYKEQMKRIVNKNPVIDTLPAMKIQTKYWPLSAVFNCTSEGGQLHTSSYPFPPGKTVKTKNSFGHVVKEEKNLYPIESIGETLKEYVKMHMEL